MLREFKLNTTEQIRDLLEIEHGHSSGYSRTQSLLLTAIKPKLYFYVDSSYNLCHMWYATLFVEYHPYIILSAKNAPAYEFDKDMFKFLEEMHYISYLDQGDYDSLYDVKYEDYSKNFDWIVTCILQSEDMHKSIQKPEDANQAYIDILKSIEDYALSILAADQI